MINLVEFFLLHETIPDYNKGVIDIGETPPVIYKICSSIRETFCLSYGIRKFNNLYLYIQKNKTLIKFLGKKLRFLGPDERSQALLLNKAIQKVHHRSNIKREKWVESTPGIQVRNMNNLNSFYIFLNSFNKRRLIIICDPISIYDINFLYHMFDYPKIKEFKEIKELNESIFLFPWNNKILINFLKSLVNTFPSMIELVTLVPLKKVKAIEEKILYINFQIDLRGIRNDLE